MNVLVAGSTGYLGRFAVQAMKAQGHRIRALARNPERLAEPGPFLSPAVQDQVDDLFVGEVTRPETLSGVCDGIDVVFSCVGLTRQKDNLTFHDVDYQGNRNILERALEASVGKFVYVSVFNAELMEQLSIVKAHEDFVGSLRESGMPYTVIRPTGYFSDIGSYFQMAASGRAFLFGDGEKRINPIHGADLAGICVEALASGRAEIAAGGPVIYTQREIAELAFSILGKPSRITRIPMWLVRAAVRATRVFNRHAADLLGFFAAGSLYENVAPSSGVHTLSDYFRELSR